MPHITVEYSANLCDRVDIRTIIENVHGSALGSGLFETATVRTRATPLEHYKIGNGASLNAFVHVTAKILAGRTAEERTGLGEALLRSLLDSLGNITGPLTTTLSVEIREIDPAASFREVKLISAGQPKEPA